MRSSVCLSVLLLVSSAAVSAQDTRPAFEVVSIKRNIDAQAGGSMRSLPDGTQIVTNQPIRSIIMGASPTPAREVVGLPDWALTERYDVTTKPPAGSTREQRAEMTRRMFAERMKLVVHVEQRERDTFALVLARGDGRLGPNLKPSALDCGPRPAGAAPVPDAAPPSFEAKDARGRCGGLFGPNSIISGGMTMDSLVQSLAGLAGGLVNNRTGLTGFYSLELTYSRDALGADERRADEPPQFLTALQEQLGLKLQPEKTLVPVLVIDHIERPTEN
jgi:uncharacterized protein (TIGR03435 family)